MSVSIPVGAQIQATSTLKTPILEWHEWKALLSDLLVDLPHLPTCKPYRAQRLLLPNYESDTTGQSTTIMETCYQGSATRISLDGEIITAIGLYLHKYREEHNPNRVYLDENFASCLGNLAFYRNSNLSYALKRLKTTEHRLVINHMAFSFQALTLIVSDAEKPYFELHPYLSEAITTALTSMNFLNFNTQSHSTLHHPVGRRLYRFLARSGIEEIFVSDLAAVLGIYTGYPDTMDDEIVQAIIPEWGKLHRALDRATAELVERRVLRNVGYAGSGNDRYAFFDVDARFL